MSITASATVGDLPENRALVLTRRPVGVPVADDWQVVTGPVRTPEPDELVVDVRYVSVDPAMRGWLDDRPSYLPPVRLGEVMRANAVGRVVVSRNARFPVGTTVHGLLGVQRYAVVDGRGVSRLDLTDVSPTRYLGVLGPTGLTAYFGLFEIGRARAGDTVVVSAAAGAVGSVAGQLARLAGCNVVGVAGGPNKCRYVVDELGFDAAVDYRGEDVAASLARLCPQGVDVYFDNVGGAVLDAVLENLAMRARVVICGAISQYNSTTSWEGPSRYWQLLVKRARMEGFLVFDYADRYPQARARLARWLNDGALRSPETIVDGAVDDFPDALLRLFRGDNIGKLVLRLTDSDQQAHTLP